MTGAIRIKRVYEHPSSDDGKRILVDRIWPRGLSREAAALDLWLKDIAPSTELRKWFGHDPSRFTEFRDRYRKELKDNPDPVAEVASLAHQGDVTLLYAAHDEQDNNAVVLAEYLKDQASAVDDLALQLFLDRWRGHAASLLRRHNAQGYEMVGAASRMESMDARIPCSILRLGLPSSTSPGPALSRFGQGA